MEILETVIFADKCGSVLRKMKFDEDFPSINDKKFSKKVFTMYRRYYNYKKDKFDKDELIKLIDSAIIDYKNGAENHFKEFTSTGMVIPNYQSDYLKVDYIFGTDREYDCSDKLLKIFGKSRLRYFFNTADVNADDLANDIMTELTDMDRDDLVKFIRVYLLKKKSYCLEEMMYYINDIDNIRWDEIDCHKIAVDQNHLDFNDFDFSPHIEYSLSSLIEISIRVIYVLIMQSLDNCTTDVNHESSFDIDDFEYAIKYFIRERTPSEFYILEQLIDLKKEYLFTSITSHFINFDSEEINDE